MALASRLSLRSTCLACWLLAACGSGPPVPGTAWITKLEAMQWAPDGEIDSIPSFRIDGFRVLDATHVLIHSGIDRSHLVTVGGACSGLGSAQRLGYTTSGGALTRSDKLIVIGNEAGAPCPVESIRALKPLPLPR